MRLPAFVSVDHVCSTYAGQKRALDPAELELWRLVTCQVDAGN